MKMKIILLPIMLISLLVSCGEDVSPASKAVHKFQNNYILEQFEKKSFQCTGAGGGGDGERYKLLSLSFITSEQLIIPTARKRIVENVLEYIREINKTKNLEEYFVEWPFKSENLVYTIGVDRGDGLWPYFPDGLPQGNKISYVNFHKGDISYSIYISNDTPIETIHEETLDEAIAILKAEGWQEPVNE